MIFDNEYRYHRISRISEGQKKFRWLIEKNKTMIQLAKFVNILGISTNELFVLIKILYWQCNILVVLLQKNFYPSNFSWNTLFTCSSQNTYLDFEKYYSVIFSTLFWLKKFDSLGDVSYDPISISFIDVGWLIDEFNGQKNMIWCKFIVIFTVTRYFPVPRLWVCLVCLSWK